jgi:pimeloyl-ACP methyl ester carboxylesterase
MADFVLVHGAWHGGWCWSRVAEPLRRAGHRVFTPTLTGLGERSHLATRETNLDTHIADINSLIEFEELRSVILCGHSYGGIVITGVADKMPDCLSTLVFLDAFIPNDGQSMQDLLPPERRLQAERIVAEQGDGWLIPARSAASFDVADTEDRAWVDRRCVPHPFETMRQGVKLNGAWCAVPRKVYVKATGYQKSPFGPYADRVRHDPVWEYLECACGHDVMVDDPDWLISLFSDVASRTA